MKTRPGFPAVARPASLKVTRPTTLSGLVVPEAPMWTKGDEWSFSWEGPAGRGTFTWKVDREEVLDGVEHYVVRSGTREFFYRKSDLAFSQETVQGTVVTRSTPSQVRYVWPLAVGAAWEQTFRRGKEPDRQVHPRVDAVAVEGEETVTVPAGTFRTLKIVYRAPATNAVYYEPWYAPDVGMFVRDREQRQDGLRARELRAFRRASKQSE